MTGSHEPSPSHRPSGPTRANQIARLTRYLVSSGVAVVVSTTTITLLVGLSWLPSAAWATLVGNLVAAVAAYHLHRRWVWSKSGTSHLTREVIPYAVTTVAAILLAMGLATLAGSQITNFHLTTHARALVIAGLNIFSFGIFWLAKLVVFNRVFSSPPKP